MEEYQELTLKKDIPALKRDIDIYEESFDSDPEIAMLQKLMSEKMQKKKMKELDEEM